MDLDIDAETTEKLDVVWDDVVFLTDSLSGKVGDFLIRSNKSLCHRVIEYEKVDGKSGDMTDAIWDGSGYSKIVSTDWKRIEYTGNFIARTTFLGKRYDADIEINFEIESGFVTSHEITKLDVIDNTERKQHDQRIKELAIKKAQKMNTIYYRSYTTFIIKPMKGILRLFGTIGSYIQDIAWKFEKKLNK